MDKGIKNFSFLQRKMENENKKKIIKKYRIVCTPATFFVLFFSELCVCVCMSSSYVHTYTRTIGATYMKLISVSDVNYVNLSDKTLFFFKENFLQRNQFFKKLPTTIF